MNNKEKTLFEAKIRKENMDEDELNFCLNFLLHTKDIENTIYSVENESKLDIIEMSFRKNKKNEYSFSGSLVLGNDKKDLELRSINGLITIKGKNIYVLTNVYRYNATEHNEYDVADCFIKNKKQYKRITDYQHVKEKINDDIILFTNEQIEQYKTDKIAR